MATELKEPPRMLGGIRDQPSKKTETHSPYIKGREDSTDTCSRGIRT